MRAANGWMHRWNIGVASAVVMGVVGVIPMQAARAQEDASAVAAAEGAGVGQAVVQQCLGMMHDAVQRTAVGIGGVVDRATSAIGALDEKGAPDLAIKRAGGRGLEAVNGWADRGHAAIDRLASRCAQMLKKLGAPEAAFAAIHEGAMRSHGAIQERAEGARRAIRAAVDAALGGGEAPE